MNGDPYRGQQSSDRRVINRTGAAPASAQTYRQSEEPQPVRDEPQHAARPTASRQQKPEKKSPNKLVTILSIVGIIVVLGVAGWFVWSTMKGNPDSGIDSSKYQAIFLTNGQIYFGKLHAYNSEYLSLTDGYYPQPKQTDGTSTTDTTTQTSSNGVQLIRLGDEVYGPENQIFISRKQVLHYENLKSDSKVAQLIDQNEKSKQ